MKISDRLQHAMDEKGMTQSDLSKKSGIAKSTLSEWLKGKYEPKQDKIYILSEILEVSPSWLFGVTDKMDGFEDISNLYGRLSADRQQKVYRFAQSQLNEQESEVQETNVIYIQSKLSAGTGIVDLDPDHLEEIEYDGYIPKHDMAFIVSGDSMTPTFEDGEIVFVEKSADIRSGQFIAVCINDEAYIKKAYIEEERLRLVSLNKDYEDIIADGDDDIRVVGRVIL